MAAVIVIVGCAMLWLEIVVVRGLYRKSLHAARAAEPSERDTSLERLLARTIAEITTLCELRACWFELFPFDTSLPRIEPGRIVLPPEEAGVVPMSDAGVELPVHLDGLPLGRLVLLPAVPSVGVAFPPAARDRAIALAAALAPPLAAAMRRDDFIRLYAESAPDA